MEKVTEGRETEDFIVKKWAERLVVFVLVLFEVESLTFLFVKVLIFSADFLKAVYFRRGPTCTIGLTNDLIDGGQP